MAGLIGDGKTASIATITGDAGQFDYGDGSDGALSWSGTSTLTGPVYATTLEIASGSVINTAGWPIFVKETCTVANSATIQCNGVAGVTRNGTAGGPAGFYGGGGQGGNGFDVSPLTAETAGALGGFQSCSASGGTGGGFGGGAAGGTMPGGYIDNRISNMLQMGLGYQTSAVATTICGGGGGGGGGENIDSTADGGGGGGGGGVVGFFARALVVTAGTLTIQANGDNGNTGATSGSQAGGGGGGGGGLVLAVYGSKTGNLTLTASGGNAGSGGSTAATAGSAGITAEIQDSAIDFSAVTGGMIGAGVQLDSYSSAAPDYGAGDYGNGRDGALTSSSGTTTLTQNKYYSAVTLTGTAVVDLNGYILFCSGTCSIGSGTKIHCSGSDASTFTGGTGGGVSSGGYFAEGGTGPTGTTGAGTAGRTCGTSTTAVTTSMGGAGGAGGSGAAASSTSAPSTATYARQNALPFAISGQVQSASAHVIKYVGGSGGSGAGAGGQKGGGGGGGGGFACVVARTLVLDGAIEAHGGNGGNGGSNASATGGGGGGGGHVVVVYHKKSGSGTTTATAGTGGKANAGAGATASSGSDGTVLLIQN